MDSGLLQPAGADPSSGLGCKEGELNSWKAKFLLQGLSTMLNTPVEDNKVVSMQRHIYKSWTLARTHTHTHWSIHIMDYCLIHNKDSVRLFKIADIGASQCWRIISLSFKCCFFFFPPTAAQQLHCSRFITEIKERFKWLQNRRRSPSLAKIIVLV